MIKSFAVNELQREVVCDCLWHGKLKDCPQLLTEEIARCPQCRSPVVWMYDEYGGFCLPPKATEWMNDRLFESAVATCEILCHPTTDEYIFPNWGESWKTGSPTSVQRAGLPGANSYWCGAGAGCAVGGLSSEITYFSCSTLTATYHRM